MEEGEERGLEIGAGKKREEEMGRKGGSIGEHRDDQFIIIMRDSVLLSQHRISVCSKL